MNYYPFHIGDYVSATRHLTWDEDAAMGDDWPDLPMLRRCALAHELEPTAAP